MTESGAKPPFSKLVVRTSALESDFVKEVKGRLGAGFAFEELADDAPRPKSKDILYVENEPGEFIKPCPCTPGAVRCGYWVFTLGFQCPYACSYCFLRFYAPDEPLTFYANLDEAAAQFKATVAEWGDEKVRLGTGEFTDSLALDPWTGHARWLADLVRPHPNVELEFKTKSDNIGELLEIEAPSNIVLAWTLSPAARVESDEPGTVTLERRLDAARRAVEHGYRVAFHFDPVIAESGLSDEEAAAPYLEVVDVLFEVAPPEKVAWISLGTLRFPRRFIDEWGPRLRSNPIYFTEFVAGEDGKLRYFWPVRRELYRRLGKRIKERAGEDAPLYLCMESEDMWDAGLGWSPDEDAVKRLLCKGGRGEYDVARCREGHKQDR